MDTRSCTVHTVWLRTGPSDGHGPSDRHIFSVSKRTLFPGDCCMLVCHLNGGHTVMVFEKGLLTELFGLGGRK
jgi:hypothetical protein